MIDYQLPDLFPNQKDVLRSISIPSHLVRAPRGAPGNAGSTTIDTVTMVGRDEDKWEKIGRATGISIGALIYVTTAPVVLLDGPLPFVDLAWLWGGVRFTHSAGNIGADVGEFIDDTLIPAFA
jgi:hypothetical protein